MPNISAAAMKGRLSWPATTSVSARGVNVYVNPMSILPALRLLYPLSNLSLASTRSQLRCTRVLKHIGHMPESICAYACFTKRLCRQTRSHVLPTHRASLLCKSAHCCMQSSCREQGIPENAATKPVAQMSNSSQELCRPSSTILPCITACRPSS